MASKINIFSIQYIENLHVLSHCSVHSNVVYLSFINRKATRQPNLEVVTPSKNPLFFTQQFCCSIKTYCALLKQKIHHANRTLTSAPLGW